MQNVHASCVSSIHAHSTQQLHLLFISSGSPSVWIGLAMTAWVLYKTWNIFHLFPTADGERLAWHGACYLSQASGIELCCMFRNFGEKCA